MTAFVQSSGILIFLVVQTVLGSPEYNPGYYLQFPPIPYNSINYNGPLPNQQLPPWLQQQNQLGQFQNQQQNQSQANNANPGAPAVRAPQQAQAYPNPIGLPPPIFNPSQQQALHNGTVLFYVPGPWGGIKTIPIVNPNIDNTITTTPPNWSSIPPIPQPPELAYFNQQKQQLQQQLQQQQQQIKLQQQQLEQQQQQVQQLSSPSPINNGPWNPGNFGWGPYSGGPSVTTQNPTGSSTPGAKDRPTTTGTSTTSTSPSKGTTTPAPAPTTDSLTKFRQLVTRIREVTRQELKS